MVKYYLEVKKALVALLNIYKMLNNKQSINKDKVVKHLS